jgi:methionyl-tRNA synthetase
MTGADEHGQKIAETAERQGMTPKQLCDTYVTKFQARRATHRPRAPPFVRGEKTHPLGRRS